MKQMFDFEVFPNWWCCVIGKYPEDDDIPESIKNDFIVVSSDDATPRETLLKILQTAEVNMGYNIKYYDNIILNGIANGFSPRHLKILSDIIIDPNVQYESQENMRIAPFARKKYTNFVYQDLFDDNSGSLKENSGSLKEKEACMQLDIRESTVPFDKVDLTEEDKLDIISYCKHDVWSSMILYKLVLKPFISTKLLVGKTFNLPENICYKSTNATLAGKVLKAVRQSFPDSNRQDIEIPNEIKQYIEYSLPKSIINRICESPEKFDTILFDNVVSYSDGGIHSVPVRPIEIRNKTKFPAWFLNVKSGNGWSLINLDGSSFYPHLMVQWDCLSRAIPDKSLYANLLEERLKLKSVITSFEDKYGKHPENAPIEEYEVYKDVAEKSAAYKLILNIVFGASKNKYLDLYDPYMCTKTCRLGQLFLTAFSNNLYNQIGKNNIKIIQSNTDGILIYIRDEYKDIMNKISKQFEEITKIPLEFEEEYQIWQRDVNNYVMSKQNGRIKTKGGFFVTDIIQPNSNKLRPLDEYVCREAMIEYITNNKDIVEHIYNESDISKFIVTCNKGIFSEIVREYNDGRPDELLHKCNRAYASLDTSLGEIKKIKYVNGEKRKYKSAGCPPHCELLNEDLSKYSISKLRDDIDYMWYIEETYNMLDAPWYKFDGDKMIRYNIINDD